jgi:hypothetical protein
MAGSLAFDFCIPQGCVLIELVQDRSGAARDEELFAVILMYWNVPTSAGD